MPAPNSANLLNNGYECQLNLALSTRLVKSAEVVLVSEKLGKIIEVPPYYIVCSL